MGYGLMQRYNIVSKIEQVTPPLLFYTVECQLVKLLDGVPHVITSSLVLPIQNESRNGTKARGIARTVLAKWHKNALSWARR